MSIVVARLPGGGGSGGGGTADLFPIVDGNIQAALDAITAVGQGVLYLPARQTIHLTTTVNLPEAVRGIRLDGDIVIDANITAFRRAGYVSGATTNITAPIQAGARTVSAVPGSLAVGDAVFVASADTLPGTTDKLGYLRVIRSTGESSVTFDVAIPRNMPDNTRRFRPVHLAGPFDLYGSGSIRYSNQETNTSTPMLQFEFCRDLTVTGVFLRDGGDRCIELSHVLRFNIDCRIDNFLDDLDANHVGYGVDCRGASRDGRVGGQISRCRHAFTTNVGPAHPEFNFYGEPENVYVHPVTSGCSNKALDTHRAGWGINFVPNDSGSGGGVQVRADNVVVSPGSIRGAFVGASIVVQPDLIVPPTIVAPKITGHSGDAAIQINSEATIIFPEIVGFSGIGIEVTAGAQVHLPAGGRVDGLGQEGTTGVVLRGSGSRISALRVANAAVGLSEPSSGSDNVWAASYTNCGVNEVLS